MSKEQAAKINFYLSWASRAALITMASVIIYFVKEIHTEYKADHEHIQKHEVRITVLEVQQLSKK